MESTVSTRIKEKRCHSFQKIALHDDALLVHFKFVAAARHTPKSQLASTSLVSTRLEAKQDEKH